MERREFIAGTLLPATAALSGCIENPLSDDTITAPPEELLLSNDALPGAGWSEEGVTAGEDNTAQIRYFNPQLEEMVIFLVVSEVTVLDDIETAEQTYHETLPIEGEEQDGIAIDEVELADRAVFRNVNGIEQTVRFRERNVIGTVGTLLLPNEDAFDHELEEPDDWIGEINQYELREQHHIDAFEMATLKHNTWP